MRRRVVVRTEHPKILGPIGSTRLHTMPMDGPLPPTHFADASREPETNIPTHAMVLLTDLSVGGNTVRPGASTHHEIETAGHLANRLGLVASVEPARSHMKTPVAVATPPIPSAPSSPSILRLAEVATALNLAKQSRHNTPNYTPGRQDRQEGKLLEKIQKVGRHAPTPRQSAACQGGGVRGRHRARRARAQVGAVPALVGARPCHRARACST